MTATHSPQIAPADSACDSPQSETKPVPPLTKESKEGGVYRRIEQVETSIMTLAEKPFDELIRRGEILDRSHPDYVPSECLVHFLRRERGETRYDRFNSLYRLVLKRVLLALPMREREVGGKVVVDAAASDITDHARSRFEELVTVDRAGGDRMDFYEIHFDEAVAKLRMNARRSLSAKARASGPLDSDSKTGELSADVERALGSFDEPDNTLLSDPRFRLRLLQAIDRLEPKQRMVITMSMKGIPIESKVPGVQCISALLGCTPKTVQNRLKAALTTLRQDIPPGDEQ